jgi:predicted glycogen debranching enzyme
MIPNHFPESGPPEYNTADATLWYLEALRAYHLAAPGDMIVEELYPVLEEIIRWHMAGTRYGIGVDPADGLLAAGEPGTQLTWMDARADGSEVTPRVGKPVEINALWYQALCTMGEFARQVGADPSRFTSARRRVEKSFQRFLNPSTGYLFDVIDGPDGHDPSLRPNQLFAVSLTHSPLESDWQRAVVDACSKHLLTPMGLRTLAPSEPGYQGRFGGGPDERDRAYHQGTVWPWLIGPFAVAHMRVHRNPEAIHRHLATLTAHLMERGTVAECAEGDPPHTPRGAFAQAWSVAELLRVWKLLHGTPRVGPE